jgi:hypothetical protein
MWDETFKRLSCQLRKFHDFTCDAFNTVELLKEKAAREHKAAHEGLGPHNPDASSSDQKAKKFNLNTYKFHAMGDYVQSIQLLGQLTLLPHKSYVNLRHIFLTNLIF